MDWNNIDPQLLPEPIRSLLQGMDLKMLEGLLSNMDREQLLNMVGSMLDGLETSMKPEEYQSLINFISSLTQSNRSE